MSLFKRKEEDTELNLERTNTIDGVAFGKDDSKLILLLADGMDWHDETKHLLLLQEKLNNYIAYIDTKQYSEKYPDAKLIEIQVKFLFKETETCKQFLEQHVMKFIKTSLPNTTLEIEYGTQETFPSETPLSEKIWS